MRKAAYAVWYYGLTVLLILLFVPAWLLPRRAEMFGIRLWSRALTWGLRVLGGVRVQIRGLERLPPGPLLIAAKHQSMFDIVPPFAYLPDACFVLKKELTAIPIFGQHCAKAELIPVDRDAGASALRNLVAAARDRLADGRQVLIFPEGTRRPPGATADYKPGVAGLYRELGVPCAPLATNSGAYLTSGGLPMRPGLVVFEILEPIPPGLKRGEFMRVLQERMETASAALLD